MGSRDWERSQIEEITSVFRHQVHHQRSQIATMADNKGGGGDDYTSTACIYRLYSGTSLATGGSGKRPEGPLMPGILERAGTFLNLTQTQHKYHMCHSAVTILLVYGCLTIKSTFIHSHQESRLMLRTQTVGTYMHLGDQCRA